MLGVRRCVGMVRDGDVGVMLRVWGWDDVAMAAHDDALSDIIRFVVNGFRAGLMEADIEEDILAKSAGRFEDASVDFGGEGEIEVVLVPAEG